MSEESKPLDILVLPQPRRVVRLRGSCRLSPGASVEIRVDDGRIDRHVASWLSQLPKEEQLTSEVAVNLVIGIDSGLTTQAYKLSITPEKVLLEGGSAVGCFYGLQTLRQMSATTGGLLPCCAIEDEPVFQTRGVLHDITRGKVPTLETLKHLVDRLSLLKINQLQLYIEHAFAYSFDSDICGDADGLTPDDARAMDEYCHEGFIELVPAVANLGHMGRILSMPKYRELAEIPANSTWQDMPWPARARGFTLDADHPASIELVEKIWRDIFAAFSSPVVNICGDEPWDLGRGRETLSDEARMEKYFGHVCRVAALCEKEGRRVQMWSDVLTKYPGSRGQLPKDITILHWGYDETADYAATASFVDRGYRTFVCPGTIGWKRIINAMDAAEHNIQTFAIVGMKAGAHGLINTDWGDHGHFNLLACSWHGITLGASLAWDADHVTGAAFDALFAHAVEGDSGREFVSALRQASAIGGVHETWRLLWQSEDMRKDQEYWPTADELEACIESSQQVSTLKNDMPVMTHLNRVDLDELAMACMFNGIAARRMLWEVRRRAGLSSPDSNERIAWADELLSCLPDYEACWRERNKETGLADIRAAIMRVVDEARMRK